MSARGVRLIVLCEDDEHQRFVLHALGRLGKHYRAVRTLVSPAGRGAADSWVRQHYAEEVTVHRRKANSQTSLALMLLIDADTHTVDDRHRQLDKVLGDASLSARGPSERIVLWVPKRHIETWVAALSQGDANESDDYKNNMRDADYRSAARRFANQYRAPGSRPADLLPSMLRAFQETDRLPA